MTTVSSTLRRLGASEVTSFLGIGLAVAVLGQFMLAGLVLAGLDASLGQAIQILATLQLSYHLNSRFTYRQRLSATDSSQGWLWARFVSGRLTGSLLNWGVFVSVLAALRVAQGAGLVTFGPVAVHSAAYWTGLAAGTGLNLISDRLWFSRPASHPSGRHAVPDTKLEPGVRTWRLSPAMARIVMALALAGLVTLIWLFTDLWIFASSAFMLVVASTTLAFKVYRWSVPELNDPIDHTALSSPELPGAIFLAARREASVLGTTLDRMAQLDHPDYTVSVIVDSRDDPRHADPDTLAIAQQYAAAAPERVILVPYPDTDRHTKPIGLNQAMKELLASGRRFEWVGIADAEDLFHPKLLRLVDERFRKTGAGVVQLGVQLMNFSSQHRGRPLPASWLIALWHLLVGDEVAVPVWLHRLATAETHLRRWLVANGSAWWRAAGCLEYWSWFKSRLHLQAKTRVMPLGGNTVFFSRKFLEALYARTGHFWDEHCLTEDALIGILASLMGFITDVVYVDEMVTREETPMTLWKFIMQRVRWMQGFIEVFFRWEWLQFPTMRQRVMAVYVLGFQFVQAFTGIVAPIGIVIALMHKAPTMLVLFALMPFMLSLLNVFVDGLMLSMFGKTFAEVVRWRDQAGLALGAYPFQFVLGVAAIIAIYRYLIDKTNWVKTDHAGAHMVPATTMKGVA